jgi:antibiotic biosynthesis monooxygenase (ABM) superfamily enzyme
MWTISQPHSTSTSEPTNKPMSPPIHVAIIRRVKPGFEVEFQQALRDFFQASFSHRGVQGANMLVPLPGSSSPEFGILRTFESEQQRDAFHESPMFKAWEVRIAPITEGEPRCRRLHGLEAWFRGSQLPPPRWKMALLTWFAVWPISMLVSATLAPLIAQEVPKIVFAGCVAAGIVAVLTWIAMPVLVKLARGWLQPETQTTK